MQGLPRRGDGPREPAGVGRHTGRNGDMLSENGKQLVLRCKNAGIPTGTERLKKDRLAAIGRRAALANVFAKGTRGELAEWYTESSQKDRQTMVWVLANVQDKAVVHDVAAAMVTAAEIADQMALREGDAEAYATERAALNARVNEHAVGWREAAAALATREGQLQKARAGAARLVERNNAAARELRKEQRAVLGLKAQCWDMHQRTQHLEQLNADIQKQVAELLEQQAQ